MIHENNMMINQYKNNIVISDVLTLKNCLNGTTLLQKDFDGRTTLYWKALYGDRQCVKTILQEARRKNILEEVIDAGHEKGWTPLYQAAFNEHTDVVRFLLQNGADANAESNEKSTVEGVTALITSCEQGYEEIVKLMIRYGADIDHKRKSGGDCAFGAARKNRLKILKLILPDNPHLVNRHLYKGLTILHTASVDSNYDVVKYILKQSNVSVNDKQNDFGDTPLGFSIQFKGDIKIVQLLIDSGADHQILSDGKTPLEWAKEKNIKEVEDYLNTL